MSYKVLGKETVLETAVLYIRNMSKRMKPICKICAQSFDTKYTSLSWFASGFVQQAGVAALFTTRAAIFSKSATIRRNVPYFHEKRIAEL